jgi:hypothetical protein
MKAPGRRRMPESRWIPQEMVEPGYPFPSPTLPRPGDLPATEQFGRRLSPFAIAYDLIGADVAMIRGTISEACDEPGLPQPGTP